MKMNNSHIEIYQAENGITEISVRLENETVWLSLNQMVDLFLRDKSVISRHISNIFKEGELDKQSVIAKNATTAADGKIYQVDFYNLEDQLCNQNINGGWCKEPSPKLGSLLREMGLPIFR